MSDVFTIGGTAVDLEAMDAIPIRFQERFGSIPTLTLQRRGVALQATPDPWLGKAVTWSHDGTTYFSGDVVSVSPSYQDDLGWAFTYQCLGLRNRLDYFPHTDSNTGIDTSPYNLTLEDPSYDAARAGRTVGQVLTDVLTMPANGAALVAAGVGNLTVSGSVYTLPAVTTADLAALAVVPPRPVYVTGEKLGDALDGLLSQWAPNCVLWIDAAANLRVLDKRNFAATTLTMGTDPIEPAALSRDAGDCFQRVAVRGRPIAVMAALKLSLGQITEDFAWGTFTNAQAKANWTPAQFRQMGTSLDHGTCTCPSTTQVTITSASGATWAADGLDQANGIHAVINLSSSTITDVTQYWTARVVSNTATSGTTTLTLDNPLPHTGFDHYSLSGLAGGNAVVWTRYQLANSALWPRVTTQSTFPQPMINGAGGATLISSPIAVVFRNDGSSFPLAFTYNSGDGTLRFIYPTYIIGNNAAPQDIWVYLPINTNPNTATYPPDSGGSPAYAGTSHSVEGLSRTLTVTIDSWRDPASLSQVQAYASDLLDSVKDTVVEGSLTYYGMFASALTCGMALQVAGSGYSTGWESLAGLAVVEVEVEWPQREGMDYRTTLHCSSRRHHYSSEMFLRPERTYLPMGFDGDPWGGAFDAPPDHGPVRAHDRAHDEAQDGGYDPDPMMGDPGAMMGDPGATGSGSGPGLQFVRRLEGEELSEAMRDAGLDPGPTTGEGGSR